MYDIDFDISVESTILHELAHAIQEWKDKEFDEEEAEDFAYCYSREGIINKI